jgi:UDP-N-acetyl-D-mannosaminuronic acid dehydrogenase
MNFNKTISIIGGAGHIGFPLGIAFANKNFKVNLVDINKKNLEIIRSGNSPFYEIGIKKILNKCIRLKKLSFSQDLKSIKLGKYIIICIGTPVNKKLKPKTRLFFNFFSNLFKYINKNHIIIIRSSVLPGVINKIAKKYGNINNNISYCPERIVQSKALIELPKLPQIVSGISSRSVRESAKLFKNITRKILISKIQEAELVKLYSNANRYINFAIANQLFLMCEKYNVNFKNVRKLMMAGYERNMNLPMSGFSAGPCLLKDTMQLSSFYKGNFGLGQSSMKINQLGMINLVVTKIKNIKNYYKKTIGILGIAFKAETDDIRDSLSIELINKLKKNNLKVIYTDTYYKSDKKNLSTIELIRKSDIVILGAPHREYKKLKIPKTKKIIDVWGIYK